MKAKQLLPIMISDFLFWSGTAGLGPLMSRLAEAELGAIEGNLIIARMLLFFTLGALLGRVLAGWLKNTPKSILLVSIVLSGLGISTYFARYPELWMVGHGLQGLSLGLYSVSMFRLTATLIPPGERMRGFALIGMADFLGFSFGPVVSGLIYSWGGFYFAFLTFMLIVVGALFAGFFLPNEELALPQQVGPSQAVKPAKFLQFLPLHLCLMICLLYHVFYSRYLPIIYDTGKVPIESLFFTGYLLGGIGVRLGIVRRLEFMSDRRVFSLAIGFMSTTALLAGLFPFLEMGLGFAAVFTGIFYGVGFETLYIFCLTFIAANADAKRRGRILAFVFMGFDLANLFAGLTFGPLANWLTPTGLMWALLMFLPLLALLPLFLKSGGLKNIEIQSL